MTMFVQKGMISMVSQMNLVLGWREAMKKVSGYESRMATRVVTKATTTERMGFTGRGEGIAAFAVVLLAE